MTCPPEIADVILDILKTGILQIRALGWSKEPERCSRQADHIHNLPDLLRNFSPDLLTFYWQTERASFIQHSSPEERVLFEPLWSRLLECMDLVNGRGLRGATKSLTT
jgi:hypothetical protein